MRSIKPLFDQANQSLLLDDLSHFYAGKSLLLYYTKMYHQINKEKKIKESQKLLPVKDNAQYLFNRDHDVAYQNENEERRE
jgi:hypothetical protein